MRRRPQALDGFTLSGDSSWVRSFPFRGDEGVGDREWKCVRNCPSPSV